MGYGVDVLQVRFQGDNVQKRLHVTRIQFDNSKPIWRESARAVGAIKRELTKRRCVETVSVPRTFGCGKRQPSVRN